MQYANLLTVIAFGGYIYNLASTVRRVCLVFQSVTHCFCIRKTDVLESVGAVKETRCDILRLKQEVYQEVF